MALKKTIETLSNYNLYKSNSIDKHNVSGM